MSSDFGECVLGVMTNKSEINSSKHIDSSLLFRACLIIKNRWRYESENLRIRKLELDLFSSSNYCMVKQESYQIDSEICQGAKLIHLFRFSLQIQKDLTCIVKFTEVSSNLFALTLLTAVERGAVHYSWWLKTKTLHEYYERTFFRLGYG